MSARDAGGPAFPVPALNLGDVNGKTIVDSVAAYTGEGGMTLMDYFAGKALAVVMNVIPPMAASEQANEGKTTIEEIYASAAYIYADAMIAEKRRRENEAESRRR